MVHPSIDALNAFVSPWASCSAAAAATARAPGARRKPSCRSLLDAGGAMGAAITTVHPLYRFRLMSVIRDMWNHKGKVGWGWGRLAPSNGTISIMITHSITVLAS